MKRPAAVLAPKRGQGSGDNEHEFFLELSQHGSEHAKVKILPRISLENEITHERLRAGGLLIKKILYY